jgi:hypothetical protein
MINGQVIQQNNGQVSQQINQEVLQNFIRSIKDAIKNKSIDTSSAMKLIVICIEIMENMQTENIDKKQYVILAINEIAKGDDLILGTSDDTISPQVYESLIVMINRDLISEVIDIICLASKGNIDVNKIKKTCFGCFSIAKNHI